MPRRVGNDRSDLLLLTNEKRKKNKREKRINFSFFSISTCFNDKTDSVLLKWQSNKRSNQSTAVSGYQTFPVRGPLRIIWWSSERKILIFYRDSRTTSANLADGPPVVRGADFGNHWYS
jgi:hypothetical protein